MKNIEPKVKAGFTRAYNKEVVLPYATNIGTIAKKAKVSLQDSGLEQEEELENLDEEKDENDIELDSMIKAKKTKKASEKKTADTESKKGKALAGKGSKGKGASSRA